MKHLSVVMTVVTRYGRKRWNQANTSHIKPNTKIMFALVMTVVTRYGGRDGISHEKLPNETYN